LENETLASFVVDNPHPVFQVRPSGAVVWSNPAGELLLSSWAGGRRLSHRLTAELQGAVASDQSVGVLLGEEGDPPFDMHIAQDGAIWLQGRGAQDAVVEQIRTAHRTKAAFLANMSHELRTPLNAILGYSELLEEEARDAAADLLPDLRRVHRAASHLLRLINDILDVSKIEAGRVGLFLETFDVLELVQEVVDTVRPLVDSNRNRLRLDVDLAQREMRGDRTKIRQLLFNLLDNACKFTEDGELVIRVESLSATDGATMLAFSVEDTGIGMSEAHLARLFEPFTQADSSTTRRYGGTGLGLALCRLLAHLMGGEIQAHSRLGEGSTFTFTVPAVVDTSGVRSTDAELGVQVHGAGNTTVLVIDDDPSVRDLLARFLVKEGYRVVCAPDGETGLEVAREQRPDAITLDVMMPQVDGWEVLRRLKADPVVGDIPVVMVSIVDNTGLGFALGASDYLTKPIDRQSLLRALAPFRGRGQGTVLVVDDHPDVRDVLARTLRKEGWTVDEANGGEAALSYLARHTPDVIVLDLLMPGVDGFTVIDRLSANPAWADIPVLVVTAKDLTPADRSRLQGGVESVVQKSGRTLEQVVHELSGVLHTSLPSDAPPGR
jgi:hypothetical protein